MFETEFDSSECIKRYGVFGPGLIEGVRTDINFRDLGGYSVAGGGKVKHGLLFRGPRLADLDSNDFAVLESLHLRYVIDFRSALEANAFPDEVPSGATYIRVAGMYVPGTGEELDFSPEQMQRLGSDKQNLSKETLTKPNSVIASSYIGMPFENPGLQTLFKALLDGGPLYFHCASGKDRTGIAAALVLLALGVSREDVLFDYSLTNTYRAESIKQVLVERNVDPKTDPEGAWLASLARGVDPAMAIATLDEIVKRYGTYEAYFAQELGLGAAELAYLCEMYVA